MKIPYAQLAKQLAQSLAPTYFVSGDETLLLQEAVDAIRTAGQQAGFVERIRIIAETGSDWSQALYQATHSLSLFDEQRLIELDLRNIKLTQKNSEALRSYAEKPVAHTLLLIYTQKLDGKSEQSAWYKALDRVSVMIPIWSLTAEQHVPWIVQRAKKLNVQLTAPAAQWLAQQVEGNLLAAAQEIEKLSLLATTEILDQQALEELVAQHTHFDIFNLADSLLLGNAARSVRILRSLLAEDTEPTLILWAISRELRTVAEISQQARQGIALSTLFSQFRIWEKKQASLRTFLKRCSPEQCWKHLLTATEIDRMIKGAAVGSVQEALERLIIRVVENGD